MNTNPPKNEQDSEDYFLDILSTEFIKENKELCQSFTKINHANIEVDKDRLFEERIAKKNIWSQWKQNIEKIKLYLKHAENETDGAVMAWHLIQNLLQKFAEENKDMKLGLVICTADNMFETDLTNVFDMMVNHGAQKGKAYLLLPDYLLTYIIKGPPAHPEQLKNISLDSFSYLHHWSINTGFHVNDAYDNELQKEVTLTANLIKHIPNIDTVVLRGCASAGELENTASFAPYEIKIVSGKKNIENEPLNNNELLLQQKKITENDTERVKTIVRYKDPYTNISVITELPNIPLNTGNKLTNKVEEALAQAAKKYQLPLLILQSKEIKNAFSRARDDWLLNKPLSQEDKNLVKAMERRTKTFQVSELPKKDSFASELEKRLEKDGIKVTIKSYVGSYQGYRTGVMGESSHGHHLYPKAVKKLR